jgi:hypothetical protein
MEFTSNSKITEHGTSGNDTPNFSMVLIALNPPASSTATSFTIVPDSFLKGLADCDAGRVVDMEKAMEEPPPTTN